MQKVTLADTHLIPSAANNAERAALSLFSVASAVYPGDNDNLINYFIREAIEAGITLGLNARKVIELCHLDEAHFSQTRWKYDFDPRARETSFRNATNRFAHAKQLKVRTLRYPQRIFGDDIVITEFIITTDQREPSSIDVFGFAWVYLSQIARKSAHRRPESASPIYLLQQIAWVERSETRHLLPKWPASARLGEIGSPLGKGSENVLLTNR